MGRWLWWWDDGEIDAGFVDRTGFGGGGGDEAVGQPDTVALVYCAVLFGSGGEYLCAAWRGGVACFERHGEIGIDGDTVFDWNGDFAGHGAAGGGATDVAGGVFVDFGGGHFVVVDSCGVDRVLGSL